MMIVGTGAGATVVSDTMVKVVSAKDLCMNIKYEVADRSRLTDMGRKEFVVFIEKNVGQCKNIQKGLFLGGHFSTHGAHSAV